MKFSAKFESKPHNYWEYYNSDIRPKLMEIDVFIKSLDEPADISATADILGISQREVMEIMKNLDIKTICRSTFTIIMAHGSSKICKLFSRELECSSPYTYTRQNIAHIYNIDLTTVIDACESLGIKEVTSFTLPLLFSNIIMTRHDSL